MRKRKAEPKPNSVNIQAELNVSFKVCSQSNLKSIQHHLDLFSLFQRRLRLNWHEDTFPVIILAMYLVLYSMQPNGFKEESY